MRETGILMPVSSLPSHTGVGELGKETEKFIGYLSASGVKIWQILPLNPVGYGNSPYQPYSSCAGDEIYISLEKLWEQKLLKELPVDVYKRQERDLRKSLHFRLCIENSVRALRSWTAGRHI